MMPLELERYPETHSNKAPQNRSLEKICVAMPPSSSRQSHSFRAFQLKSLTQTDQKILRVLQDPHRHTRLSISPPAKKLFLNLLGTYYRRFFRPVNSVTRCREPLPGLSSFVATPLVRLSRPVPPTGRFAKVFSQPNRNGQHIYRFQNFQGEVFAAGRSSRRGR